MATAKKGMIERAKTAITGMFTDEPESKPKSKKRVRAGKKAAVTRTAKKAVKKVKSTATRTANKAVKSVKATARSAVRKVTGKTTRKRAAKKSAAR